MSRPVRKSRGVSETHICVSLKKNLIHAVAMRRFLSKKPRAISQRGNEDPSFG